MHKMLVVSIVSVVVTALASVVPAGGDPGAAPGRSDAGGPLEVQLIVDKAQAADLRAQGFTLRLTRVKGGKTVRQFAAAQAAGGFQVWRSFDEAGGIRDQMYAASRRNPQIAKLVRIGTSIQGREILALKLTQGARDVPDGSRPAVLYSSTQHAREWISTEVNRRLMNHYIDRWRAKDSAVRNLLATTELWFVLVANPDGYQYTFDSERLWRKNLRDNNGDGQITVGDGVDPNRNFPNHWGYDNEGSSPIESSETYRGTAPMSEPETVAMVGLFDRVAPEFQVNWHSAGQWILYAEGWQIATPTADDPIYYALSGNLDDPAVEDFHPGLSSDVLYVTNGETTDYAHSQHGTLAWTPELSEGCDGCGFVFPDDDQLVQEEFLRNLPFADSVARSATDPDDPKTVTGISTKPFYIDSDDAYKSGIPGVQLSFTKSYGDAQPVAVLAKRSLGAVSVKYRINGGPVQTAPTSEWDGGSTYTPASTHYHQMRGTVTGTDPGDSVEVWFEGGGETSASFTYEAVSESGNRVLVVAAEDYTGASPPQDPGPHYVDYYLDALAANGESADVYDVDANGRGAPDALGVLSHYDAAIWYTGDDIVTRTAGRGPGNADRLAMDQILEMRAFMNEGGKVLYTGNWAGEQYTGNVGTQLYDPQGEIACNPLPPGTDPRRCLALRGSGDGTNDVLQYYFGGDLAVLGDGLDDKGHAFDIVGTDDPFTGLEAGLNKGTGAKNQDSTSSFISTSGILPVEDFKQFESWPAARWDKPGGPFDPHTGTQYVYSQIADVSRTTGPPSPTPTATPRRRPATAVPRAGSSCTRTWRTIRPGTASRRVRPPARPGRGTQRAATPTAGSSGAWTCLNGPAGRSRSRSPTPATGRCRTSASSSTTSSSPTARPPRSRPASMAGRSPARPRAARPTATTSSAPTPPASPSATRSRPRARCCSASVSKASRRPPSATR